MSWISNKIGTRLKNRKKAETPTVLGDSMDARRGALQKTIHEMIMRNLGS